MKGSDRLNALSESETLAMSKRVRELTALGKNVVGLTLGEPDFDTPAHICEAAIQAIRENDTHYPPVAGKPELLNAVAQHYQQRTGISFTSANVIVSTGAKQSLVNVIMSLVNPGEEALLIAPYWVSYLEMLKIAEAVPVTIQTTIENGFKLKPSDLEAAITPNTKLFIFNNPSNPSGANYTREELAGIVSILEKNPHVHVISDEIYEYITYEQTAISMASFPEILDRLVIVNGVSKAFAMTGWRIGFTIAPEWLVKMCEKYQGQITSGASTISQRAALAAITGSLDPVRVMRKEFERRRNFLHGALQDIPGINTYLPGGAFYFYPDLSRFIGLRSKDGKKMTDIDTLSSYILDVGGLAVISGTAFGTKTHIRISYAYEMSSLEEAMIRLKSCLVKLK